MKNKETLEEAAEKYSIYSLSRVGFIDGAKWQQEQDKNKFSEEWWSNLSDKFYESNLAHDYNDGKIDYRHIRNWFLEQFKNK